MVSSENSEEEIVLSKNDDGGKNINPYDGTAQAIPIPKTAEYLTTLPLTFIIFFSVSGGPFYAYQAVRSGGNFYALCGYLIAPFIIAWPETVMTAELSVAYPHSSGSVVWCQAAFGPFVGWLNGILSISSGIVDAAIFPGLFVNFVLGYIPKGPEEEENLNQGIRFGVFSSMIFAMGVLNWSGLNAIGNSTIFIGIIVTLPFVFFVFLAMLQVNPSRWLELPSITLSEYMAASEYELGGGFFPYATVGGVLLRPFLNTLFWNHNAFDSTSTFSEDCGKEPKQEPARVIANSLHNAWFLIIIFQVFPLFAAIGVSDGDQVEWQNGYIASLASDTAGPWLGNWLVVASGISNIALYQAEMSSAVFKLMGMAHNGLLPKFLGVRSAQGTPTNAIIFATLIIIVLTMWRPHKLIEAQNFNYGIAVLLEYASFIKLRISQPDVRRPYRVPFGTVGCILSFIPPFLVITAILLLASYFTMLVGVGTLVTASVTYLFFAKPIFEKRDNQDNNSTSSLSVPQESTPMKGDSDVI